MTGRGNFISLKNLTPNATADSNSDKSTKDSGVCSRSPASSGEYRRVGRGKLIDELTYSCSDISISTARGRARIFEAISHHKNSALDKNDTNDSYVISSGRGNAKVVKHVSTTYVSNKRSDNTINSSQSVELSQEKPMCEEKKTISRHGTKGFAVSLACNYIRLCTDSTKGVFVYEVRFSPNIDSVSLRMKYLNEHRDEIGETKTFDGVTLYLPILLANKLTTFVSKGIDNSEVEIRILFKRKELIKDCIHLFNVLFDRIMKTLNYVRFERKQFDPASPKIIPHYKLEVWPGYVTAVDELEGGLMLCCDVSHRLLYQKTVLDALIEIFTQDPDQFHENSKKSLLGAVVITRYNNRTYRIDDICFDKNPMSTFKYRQSEITYIEYYHINHNIEIKDKKQPLLISIKKIRASGKDKTEDFVFCLLPEVCYLTGIRDDMRSDFKLMREIAAFTRVSPNQRLLALEKFCKNVDSSEEAKKILNNWGLKLKQSYEYITGRQFEEEGIYFSKKAISAGINADFSKYANSNELLDVVHLQNWLLIYCKQDSKIAKSYVELIDKNSHILGVSVRKPKEIVLDNDRIDTYVCALRNNIKSGVQIAICICPTIRDDRYAAIKKVCCAEMPIPSQVINAKTLSNHSKNRSIVLKIALQINCKLGGALWSVKIPFKNVMICGIDSYHDSAQKGNSVSAFVASLNCTYTKWYSKAVIQSKREEIVNGLCSSLISALIAYEKENGMLPANVIIYRDGVGDGQLQLCSNYEIPQLLAACKKGFPDYPLKVTFLVVQKRINTRYFTIRGSNVENPLPGTVVDNKITQLNMFDFFLVSQSVRQGTVSPTHFIVLRNDADYNPDILQRLSYKLCFLYYNWPGTIRIPACCQYAHKMAYLIGQSIQRSTSDELSKKLFYL